MRLFHTLRFLRWPQLSGQVLRALRGPVRGPGWKAWSTSALGDKAHWRDDVSSPARLRGWQAIDAAEQGHHTVADLAQRRFRFLGTERTFEEGVDWHTTAPHYLWGYNLNYFEFLHALRSAACSSDEARPEAARVFRLLVESWLASADALPHRGREPYPTSLRLVEWCKTVAILGDALPEDLRGTLADACAWQADAVSRMLETHLLGNHLLENARALLVAAASLTHPQAAVWERTARRILAAELREQVLADGAHFERSPMYHGLMQRLVLDALVVTPPTHAQRALLASTASAMEGWQAQHLAPDGDIACANDAQRGIAPDPQRLAAAGQVIGLPPREAPTTRPSLAWSPEGGYATLRRGRWHLLFDAGAAGPSYQAGHAHCDALSVQAWHEGRPWLVDPGVSSYIDDQWRRYARSTRAHNTVQVDGRDQSEVWSAFRMGRQVRILGMAAGEQAAQGVTWAWGAVRGYGTRAARHDRWLLLDDAGWVCLDRIEGADAEAIARWHCAPNVTAQGEGPWALTGDQNEPPVIVTPLTGQPLVAVRGSPEPLLGWYFTRFATQEPTTVLSLASRGATPGTLGVSVGDRESTPVVTVSPLGDGLVLEWGRRLLRCAPGRVEVEPL